MGAKNAIGFYTYDGELVDWIVSTTHITEGSIKWVLERLKLVIAQNGRPNANFIVPPPTNIQLASLFLIDICNSPAYEVPDEMVLTFCGTCLKQFIYSPEHIVRRIDRTQSKEPCMYCHVRDGYNYRITHKKKRLGDDRY